jgi:hypothetical protein
MGLRIQFGLKTLEERKVHQVQWAISTDAAERMCDNLIDGEV